MNSEPLPLSSTEGIWDETPGDLDYLSDLVRKRAGISLESKRGLFGESRLLDLLYREKIGTVGQLVARLKSAPESYLHRLVVEALAIQETSFYRDQHPFVLLQTVLLPWLAERRQNENHMALWSAATSTGQEAYSLAMVSAESLPVQKGWRVDVLGTDLSQENVRRAREGQYSQFDVNRGLPTSALVKHFTKAGELWSAREELRRRVVFQEMNLIDPWTNVGKMDVVFLRNVLMYLDEKHRRDVVERMRGVLRSDGFLVLGAGERLSLEQGYRLYRWKSMDVYQPQESPSAPTALIPVESK